MKILSLSLLLLLAATVSQARPSVSVPRLVELLTSDSIIEKELERLENERLSINYHNCRSWHLGVETSNIIDFKTVPANCKDYVEDYLTSEQYRADSKTVCKEAYFYAKEIPLKNDTINVWIFDVDDTLLSSVPFYAQYGYGTVKREHGAYWNWVRLGESAPVLLPETLTLYNNLLELGIEPIFVTERWEDLEEITRENLKAVGFTYWRRTIFKPTNSNIRDVKYKSEVRKSLVESGYTIIGNIGDQWADIPEDTPGRVFKLPNPLYVVPS